MGALNIGTDEAALAIAISAACAAAFNARQALRARRNAESWRRDDDARWADARVKEQQRDAWEERRERRAARLREFVRDRELVRTSRHRFVASTSSHWPESAEPLQPLLGPPDWVLVAPLSLVPSSGCVRVAASREARRPASGAVAAALAEYIPPIDEYEDYPRMSAAVSKLERPEPGRFADRECYQVEAIRISKGAVCLDVSQTHYFDAFDASAAFEIEAIRSGATLGPARRELGLPWEDLAARVTVASVSALTIRRADSGQSEFWLHRRSTDLGMVQGQRHVVPSGVFQPAVDKVPGLFERDAQLWHTILRETVEELLGFEDADGRAVREPAYEEDAPYADFTAAAQDGYIRPWLLGFGLDPMSLWLEVLAAVVYDAEVFDRLFPDLPRHGFVADPLVATQSEGQIIGPFPVSSLRRAADEERNAPAAAATMRLAATHLETLLA